MGRPATADAKLPFPPFGAFDGFLKDLSAMDILPNRIDNGVFGPSYSGSAKSQILQTMRSFRLINLEGTVDSARLQPLLNEQTRDAALAGVLKEFYAGLFALPLASATPSQVNEWFAQHGLDSQTERKARAFFLAAAKATGVSVHSTVLSKARRGGRRRVKRQPSNGVVEVPGAQSATTTVKRIEFRSGGWASLTFEVDWNTLSKDDRRKLFGWLDSLADYDNPQAQKTRGSSDHDGLPESEYNAKDEEVPF